MLLISSLLLACSSPNYPCGDCGSRQMRTRTGLSRTCFSARESCRRLGRTAARCLTTCWTLAPHIVLGGGADVTVVPSNATEIVKHRDRQAMDRRTRSAGAPLGSGYGGRLSPADLGQRNGRSAHRVVHRPHMAHGTPLATGEADHECGAAGPFLLEVGISSSYHIARFFRLTNAGLHSVSSAKGEFVKIAPEKRYVSEPAGHARFHPRSGGRGAESGRCQQEHRQIPPSPHSDIAAVITKALKGAGLIKG